MYRTFSLTSLEQSMPSCPMCLFGDIKDIYVKKLCICYVYILTCTVKNNNRGCTVDSRMRQFSLCSLLWVTEKRTDFWVLKILPNSNTTVFSTRNCEWKCFQPEPTIDVCLAWRVLWFGKDLMEAYKWKKQKWIMIINSGKFTSLSWVLTTHVMKTPGKYLMTDYVKFNKAFPSPPQAHATYSSKVYSFLRYLTQLSPLFGIFTKGEWMPFPL